MFIFELTCVEVFGSKRSSMLLLNGAKISACFQDAIISEHGCT